MKKRIFALLLTISLLISIFSGSTVALDGKIDTMPNGEPIYYTFANDVLQELKYSTIPIIRNGEFYIPYTLLTNNFNIRSSYDEAENVLYLSNIRDTIRFDINKGTASDKNNDYVVTVILSKGTIFLPLEFICRYLKLSYAYIAEGPILRVRDENYTYPDLFLSHLFDSRMREMRDELLESLQPPVVDPPSVDPPPVEKDPVTVYLTFDDGPSEYTASILRTLKEYDCKATFFLVGNRLAKYEKEVRNIFISGHTLGLHSYSHNREEFYASTDAMLGEFDRSNDLLRRILLTQTRLVRIPYGSSEKEFTAEYRDALENAGYRFWDWTIHANDISEDPVTPEQVLSNIVTQLETSDRETEVILIHDCAVSAEMLPKLLTYLKDNNYIVAQMNQMTAPINMWTME